MAIAKQIVGRVGVQRGKAVKARVAMVRPPSKFALAVKSLRPQRSKPAELRACRKITR